MDPFAGLLSPEDRRRSKNVGLLAGGLQLIQNSSWKNRWRDGPQDTLSNIAGAAQTGIAAYMGANDQALQAQEYRQQQMAARQQAEQQAEMEGRLKTIVGNIGQNGTFATPAQRAAWVADATSGGVEHMQEAIGEYRESLNPETKVVGKDSRLVQTGPDGVETVVDAEGDKWWDAFSDSDMPAVMAVASDMGYRHLEDIDPASVDMYKVLDLLNQQRAAGAAKTDIQLDLGEKQSNAVDDALAGITGGNIDELHTMMNEVVGELELADLQLAAPGFAITGAFADQRLDLARVASMVGMASDELEADISKTELMKSQLGVRLFNVLASGALGSGSGISDKDMEVAAEVAQSGLGTTERGRVVTSYFAAAQKIGQVYDRISRMNLTPQQRAQLFAQAKGRIGDLHDLRRKYKALADNDGNLYLPHLQDDFNQWEAAIQQGISGTELYNTGRTRRNAPGFLPDDQW